MWGLALALNELLTNKGYTPEMMESETTRKTADMMDAFYKIKYFGVTGNVAFERGTGDRLGLGVIVENMQLGKEVIIGTSVGGMFNITKPIMWHHDMRDSSTYINVSLKAPLDEGVKGPTPVQTISLRVVNDDDSGLHFLQPYGAQYNSKNLAPMYVFRAGNAPYINHASGFRNPTWALHISWSSFSHY